MFKSYTRVVVLSLAVGMVLGVAFSALPLAAQDFYIKTEKTPENKGFEKSPWPLHYEFGKNPEGLETLRLTDTQLLRQMAQKPEDIPFDPIVRRELSNLEKSVDAAFLIFSSLLIMMTHDVYDLSSEFRILRIQGVIFFVFPSDTSILYYRCGNKEYEIASSDEPSEKELLDMKTLDEARALCGQGSGSQPSS